MQAYKLFSRSHWLSIGFTLLLARNGWAMTSNARVAQENDPNAASIAKVLINRAGKWYSCFGTFVARDFLLTAKHCTGGTASKYFIVYKNPLTQRIILRAVIGFGGDKREALIRSQKLSPPEALVAQAGADVALLYFKGGLPRGATIARLFKGPQSLLQTKKVFVYGANDLVTGPFNYGLRTVKAQPRYVMDYLMLLRNENSVEVCRGDSGSPVFIRVGNHDYLVGLLSLTAMQSMRARCGNTFQSLATNLHYELERDPISRTDWFERAFSGLRRIDGNKPDMSPAMNEFYNKGRL